MGTTAGGGATQVAGQDGRPASDIALNQPRGIETWGDAIVFADSENHLVRRLELVGDEWTLLDVAGNGAAGFLGDGGLAVEARLDTPYSVAVDAEGIYYLADTGNHRVRTVDGDAVIHTIVGGQGTSYPGDGSDGLELGVGYPPAVALGAEGHLYFVDGLEGAIRMMDPDGVVTTLLTLDSASGERTLPDLAYPSDLCLIADGKMIIADPAAGKVLEVTP